MAHHRAGRLHDAEVCYRRALAVDMNCADGWHLLGMIADAARQSDEAIKLIHNALRLAPSRADFYNNLGTIHEQRGEYDLAEKCLREALRLQPQYAVAHNNLGEVLKDLGRVNDSLACYRAALSHAPSFYQAGSNLLMGLNYAPEASQETIANEHRAWGQRMMRGISAPARHENDLESNRPLRIGYVSPDFRQHAVARFFEPILSSHDRDHFEIYLYSEAPVVDAVSQRLKGMADNWRMIRRRSGAEVAEQIRSDRIDILVDLAGHTRDNRLDVFIHRPAPVQATYLGYPNTTGLECIDYRISDAVIDPPAQATLATEQILRLSGHSHCFLPPDDAPATGPVPSVQRGIVTFGSHHPPIKLNDGVLDVWRRVLEAVPDSLLLLFRNSFNAAVQKELARRMAECHVSLDRVEFRCPSDKSTSYLPLFGEIDIVLDSFPFTGHTMTCEALWMGVPVVTLRGDRPSGRLSASVLEALGLRDLIAGTPNEYVLLAERWANSAARRRELRAELRSMMRARICDGTAFTRRLEGAYRWMWERWCGSAPTCT